MFHFNADIKILPPTWLLPRGDQLLHKGVKVTGEVEPDRIIADKDDDDNSAPSLRLEPALLVKIMVKREPTLMLWEREKWSKDEIRWLRCGGV
eukprot:scaffold2299_cov156-Chaetoceros_neogracile.AAC.3